MTDVTYSIDGKLFSNYSVYVSGTSGIVEKPEMKEPLSADYGAMNGVMYDLSAPRYKERKISVKCFIEAYGYDDFLTKMEGFLGLFMGAGLHTLVIDTGSGSPLVYAVFSRDVINPDKEWNDTHFVGTFTLNLVEPDPVKMVIRVSGSGASIGFSSDTPMNIYWGDGTATYGTKTGGTHSYSGGGRHYVIVAGDVDNISGLSGGTVIWSKLI